MSGPLVQALEKRRQEDLAKTQPLTPGTLEWAWAQAQKPFKGYWDRQGLMAREGLAMADQGAQQVRQGDLSGLAGMVLGPANYLSSPINALFPIEEAQTQLPKSVSPFVAGGLELMALAAPGPKGARGLTGRADDLPSPHTARPNALEATDATNSAFRVHPTDSHVIGNVKLAVPFPDVPAVKTLNPQMARDATEMHAWKAEMDSAAKAQAEAAEAYFRQRGWVLDKSEKSGLSEATYLRFKRADGVPLDTSKKGQAEFFNRHKSPSNPFGSALDVRISGHYNSGGKTTPHLQWSINASSAENAERVGKYLDSMEELSAKYPRGGQAVATSRDQALANLTEAPEGITAYHGSPHTFDKFDMSKIGTGEGAQAYGHGLYFAENEAVAKGYRDTLTKSGNVGAQKRLQQAGGDIDKAIADSRAKAEKYRSGGADTYASAIEEDLRFLEDYKRTGSWVPGATYQVRLNVKPDELLDWDRPLSEQPIAERTKEILKSAGIEAQVKQVGLDPMSMTGEGLHGWIRDPKQAAKATEQLQAAGIKGIRYKDAGSRDKDGGTYNYVIFDDKLVDILKRYAIPFTLGAGGAAIVSGQDMPPEVASQLGPQA